MIVPVISGLIEGFYSLNISDVNNCELSLGTVALNDIQMDCIKIPNAFTPNSDAVNDTWDIENIDIFPWADIYVYNRWGQQIYYAKPTEPPWDGRFNGDYVPTGTYLYVIQLYNQTKPYTGTVSVVY
jgi:gliding motility-associated-like protein